MYVRVDCVIACEKYLGHTLQSTNKLLCDLPTVECGGWCVKILFWLFVFFCFFLQRLLGHRCSETAQIKMASLWAFAKTSPRCLETRRSTGAYRFTAGKTVKCQIMIQFAVLQELSFNLIYSKVPLRQVNGLKLSNK